MTRVFSFLLVLSLMVSCNDEKSAPDVSGIKVELKVQRFDQDFFAIDTNALESSMTRLQQRYPEFLRLFLNNIVGVSEPSQVVGFYRVYKPVYDSSAIIYKDLSSVKTELEQALRYVRYYFPAYEIPVNMIALVGPMQNRQDLARMTNGEYTTNLIGPGLIGISLQYYLGAGFSFYQNQDFINEVAPLYRSRRFSKEYITADVMKLVTDDLFPDKSNRLPLIEQMVEKGKQWWLLDKFLPHAPDSVKTGYTARQLSFCEDNEGMIWSAIVSNEKLDAIDPSTIQTYIGEAPFTQSIAPDVSPGNIGQWIGWQIVKKYAAKNSDRKIEEVMKASPREILEEAKYKPK